MNKTSTRLTAAAGFILLGVFAIALAQHDSRSTSSTRPSEEPSYGGQQPLPLAMDTASSPWQESNGTSNLQSYVSQRQPLVRANNDSLPTYPALDGRTDEDVAESAMASLSDESSLIGEIHNPLRDGVVESALSVGDDENSAVVLASGQVPNGDGTVGPPAWLNNLPNSAERSSTSGSAGLPSLPSLNSMPGPGSGNAASGTPLPSSTSANSPANPTTNGSQLPSFPLPTTRGELGNAIRNSLSDSGNSSYSDPPNSDVQTPRMVPTDLVSPPRANNSSVAATQMPPLSTESGVAPKNLTPIIPSNTSANPPLPSNAGLQQPVSPTGSAYSFNDESGKPSDDMRPVNVPGYANIGNSRSTTPIAAVGQLVSNRPGNRALMGMQNPVMHIQKYAPDQIQVGKKATFVITIRNAGNATAHDVTVLDSVPSGARFADAMPPTTPTAEGMLVWKLGELAPGDERSITMQLIPDVQGDIGSVASVQFATQASVHTVATMPKLELRLDTRSEVLIGGRHQVRATLVNTGSGTARGVRLEADIPTQLRHSTGDQQLEAPLGDLAPQQSRSIDLDLAAVNPGRSNCTIRVITDDGPQAEESVAIEVKAAQLLAQIDGPKMRYLDRPATFRVQVVNSGTASATNCEFLINLPIGLEFRGANNSGSYDPNTHSITWGLEELPTSEPAIIEFDVIPRSLGPQAMR
ncbi:MAG: DUF11 domain-containing protein, partial [Planctomycetales bacterium]|nr:DUF11 domain-containing protein [Planctomycetales bacterium]